MSELGLANAEVLHERLQALGGQMSFDLAVSRAIGAVKRTLAPSLSLVAPGGRLVLYKGPRWRDERASAERIAHGVSASLAETTDVELPGLNRTTTFVTFEVRAEDPPDGA